MCLAVLYWYVWIVAIPKWRGYTVEEEMDVLNDGTSITSLVKVRNKEAVQQIPLRERLRSWKPSIWFSASQ